MKTQTQRHYKIIQIERDTDSMTIRDSESQKTVSTKQSKKHTETLTKSDRVTDKNTQTKTDRERQKNGRQKNTHKQDTYKLTQRHKNTETE